MDADSQAQLIGLYRVPSPVVFEGACAGASVETYIGDYDARVTLPQVESTLAGEHGDFRTWTVCAPNVGVSEDVFVGMFEERRDPSQFQVPRWGEVRVHPQVDEIPQFLVSDLVIEYEVLSVEEFKIEETARGKEIIQDHFVMDFFAKIDPWFERVASWLSVLVDQPLDVAGRLKMSLTEGENLVVTARIGSEFTNASHIAWSAPMHRRVEPVTEAVWRHAISAASDGALPPVVYQLLAQARVALELEDFRLAIIQAATAVEVSLAQRVERDVETLGSPLVSALGSERRTLGALVRTLGKVYDLPAGAPQFVNLRNRSIHKNHHPSWRLPARSFVRSRRHPLPRGNQRGRAT